MTQHAQGRTLIPILLLAVALAATGCGGGVGAGGGTGTGTGTTPTGKITGSGFAGPFQSGGLVRALRVSNGQPGTALATGSTDASGGFELRIQDTAYQGPVILELTGRFYDEATAQIQDTGPSP
ncbi:MAG: hypothetical protein HY303_12835, partial [Candidatus Wallbacteria bacterium]|nr:hypothetical protein [Candidatus Wallbacteria bacterium]